VSKPWKSGRGFLIKPLEKTELIAQIRAMKRLRDANAVRLSEIGELKSLAAQQTQKIERELAERKVVEKALRESEIDIVPLLMPTPIWCS